MDFSGMGAPTTASPASPAPSPERSGAGPGSLACGSRKMPSERRVLRCAVYTRKSSEHGLEQDFNSLDAQREAGEAYVKSQSHEGWKLIRTAYDDGGLSGATMERPALQRLLADIGTRLIDVVVVYKVDRLTRSLADFAKLIETFEAHGVSFVSVTQQFNTTTWGGLRSTCCDICSVILLAKIRAGARQGRASTAHPCRLPS